MTFVLVALVVAVVVVAAVGVRWSRRRLPPRDLDAEMQWEHHDCGGPDVED